MSIAEPLDDTHDRKYGTLSSRHTPYTPAPFDT
jgi:hypothetical protein